VSTGMAEMLGQFDPTLPLERAHTIPSSWYRDRAIYDAECRTVFAHTWQMVGRLDQLTEAGSFLTADLAGEPIAVVRDPQGAMFGIIKLNQV